MSPQKLVLCAVVMMSVVAVEAGCADVTARLYDLVLVSSESVCLGDLAELVGPDDAVNLISSTCIAISNREKLAAVITPTEISQRIPGGTILHFTGAPAVYVSSREEYLDVSLLLPPLQNRLNRLAGDSLSVSVKLSGSKTIPQGTETIPIQISIHDLDKIFPGEQVITLIRLDGNGRVKRQHLKVKVSATARLGFPVKVIKRGEVIGAGDIEARVTDLQSNHMQGLVLHPGSLEGLEASRLLSPGNPVRWDHVSLPPEVRKGDGVEVVVEAENFAIRAMAEALQSGSAGDEIWVRLENNGRRMHAVVVGPTQVAIH